MTARFIVGDVLEVLPTLEAGSVDLVLTSPPFLALRSYLPADHPDKAKEGGSQPTPGAFIDWLVDVVEALDRVLAPHGSMVIELGDTYAGGTGFQGTDDFAISKGRQYWVTDSGTGPMRDKNGSGWPADKSLTLIPELFRMTLVYGFNPLTGRQTKRWRLRNVIRWVRPNPPVGALGDKFRPATSELMVFCRTDEAGRKRFFDLDAVREQGNTENGRPRGPKTGGAFEDHRDSLGPFVANSAGAPPLDWWNIPLLDGEEETPYGPPPPRPNHGRVGEDATGTKAEGRGNWSTFPTRTENPLGPPPLDWWEFPPGGYSGAHYAVFPEALCVRPIKAMCPEKVCRTCGEPSRRIVEKSDDYAAKGRGWADLSDGRPKAANRERNNHSGQPPGAHIIAAEYNTLGFTDCGHDNYRPGLVLDPFAGSGTTLAVAVGHGRDAIGIDLDSRNADLARERVGMFLEAV